MKRPGRVVVALLAAVPVAVAAFFGSGWLVFNRAAEDALRPADAAVVLGGEHDGREEYGLDLARRGLVRDVLMSDPYLPADPIMRRYCATAVAGVRVLCAAPEPSTTRGEAQLACRFADAYGWRSIIVVTWRFHLPRTRLIFDQCYRPGDGRTVSYRAVPREYDYSALRWGFTYLYQSSATVKALLQRPCSQPARATRRPAGAAA